MIHVAAAAESRAGPTRFARVRSPGTQSDSEPRRRRDVAPRNIIRGVAATPSADYPRGESTNSCIRDVLAQSNEKAPRSVAATLCWIERIVAGAYKGAAGAGVGLGVEHVAVAPVGELGPQSPASQSYSGQLKFTFSPS